MIYGNKLRKIRENHKLTQEETSKIINIERGLYSQYETEYTIMPIKHINTLCNYFNISIDYLFNLQKEKNYLNTNNEIDKNKSKIRIKEFRKNNKLTQNKLAEQLNIGQSTIAEYERGRNIIATPFLYTICQKYNISADYLLGKIDEPQELS